MATAPPPTSSAPSTTDGMYRAVQVTALSPSIESGIERLHIQRLHRQPLKEGQVRVSVYAACVNFFDLLILTGRYQTKPPLPFTLGSECSGRIIECGVGVKQWQVGDAVVVAMVMGGGMAEEVIVAASHCLPAPTSFTWAESSALGVGFYTAYNGLVQRGQLRSGEWLMVTGAGGGMGLAAVQLGVRWGCRVIAVASTADKLRAAATCGAVATIASDDDLKKRVKDITGGHLIDVLYDVVGGELFDRCLHVMAGGGRMLVVGFTGGKIQSVAANLILVKGVSVLGVRAGTDMRMHPHWAAEMNQQMRELTSGEKGRLLAPVIDSQFEAENFALAYRKVFSRSVIGKAVVAWKEEAMQQQHTRHPGIAALPSNDVTTRPTSTHSKL